MLKTNKSVKKRVISFTQKHNIILLKSGNRHNKYKKPHSKRLAHTRICVTSKIKKHFLKLLPYIK